MLAFIIIRFVIPVVFIIKLDWSVCICVAQLYGGRVMYRVYYMKNNYTGTAVAQWLRCCATNRKVASSVPDGVIGIFH